MRFRVLPLIAIACFGLSIVAFTAPSASATPQPPSGPAEVDRGGSDTRVLLAADEDTPVEAASPEETYQGLLSTTGEKMILDLPPIAFGIDQKTFLQARRDNKPFASSRSTLVSNGIGDAIRYKYTDTSLIRAADASAIEVQTTGTFGRYFQPERIEWEIIHQDKNGDSKREQQSIEVGEKEIVRKATNIDGKTTEQRFERPEGRWVYLTGDLLVLMKLGPGQRFILRDLDPDTGKLQRRVYEVSRQEDKVIRVSIRKLPSKVETEYYLIHEDGHILRHVLHDLGTTFEAASEARIRAIEEGIRRRRTWKESRG